MIITQLPVGLHDGILELALSLIDALLFIFDGGLSAEDPAPKEESGQNPPHQHKEGYVIGTALSMYARACDRRFGKKIRYGGCTGEWWFGIARDGKSTFNVTINWIC